MRKVEVRLRSVDFCNDVIIVVHLDVAFHLGEPHFFANFNYPLVVKGKEVHEVVKCIEVPDAEDVLLDEVRLFLEVRVRLNVVAAMKFCLDTKFVQAV